MASNALTNIKKNVIAEAAEQEVSVKKNSNVVKKDYILNDLEALKKKLDNEHLKPEIKISNEAVDGGNTTITMKTSLFEYCKQFLMETLKKDDRIIKAEAVKKVVADTNYHGEADVEFQLEISFKVNDFEHKVKVLCYTTTCRMMVQQMEEAPGAKSHLENKHVAKYFAEKFLLTFGENVLASMPNIDDQFIPKLKEEMKRLQQLFYKSKKKNIKPLAKPTKCSTFNKCKKGGNVQIKNTDVYARCVLCDGCEHFMCAGIKDTKRANIINRIERFVCTVGFAKNPKKIAFEKDGYIKANNLAIEVGQETQVVDLVDTENLLVDAQVHALPPPRPVNDEDEITVVQVDEVTLDEEVEPQPVNVGKDVSKQTGFWELEDPKNGANGNVEYPCNECNKIFYNQEDLCGHTEMSHANIEYLCTVCSFKSKSKTELEEHILIHEVRCNLCNETFHVVSDLEGHTANHHRTCAVCKLTTINQEELDRHNSDLHGCSNKESTLKCEVCEFQTIDTKILEEHKRDKHENNQAKCGKCEFQTSDTKILDEHKLNNHEQEQNQTLVDKSWLENILKENENLKTELVNLKDDFERLNDIFENTQNTNQDQDRNSETELTKVREEYRIVKTENEFLKEKNDTLFKLGKIALKAKEKEPEVEALSDDDDSGLDALVKSTLENRSNSYVRDTPASYAEKTKPKEVPNKPQPRPAPRVTGVESNVGSNGIDKGAGRVNYCHFFSNLGYCKFEKENNRKCKFSHSKAPTCSFDGRCNRKKCMFTHTKTQFAQPQPNFESHTPFLGVGGPFPPMNPAAFQFQMDQMMQQVRQMQQMQSQPRWENAHWQ